METRPLNFSGIYENSGKRWRCALIGHSYSFAIHLRAMATGFAPISIVIVAGLKELKSSFCA